MFVMMVLVQGVIELRGGGRMSGGEGAL